MYFKVDFSAISQFCDDPSYKVKVNGARHLNCIALVQNFAYNPVSIVVIVGNEGLGMITPYFHHVVENEISHKRLLVFSNIVKTSILLKRKFRSRPDARFGKT